ncbi:MAG: hypothetical protein ACOC4Z_01445 [Patescibacteria group bacterium]
MRGKLSVVLFFYFWLQSFFAGVLFAQSGEILPEAASSGIDVEATQINLEGSLSSGGMYTITPIPVSNVGQQSAEISVEAMLKEGPEEAQNEAVDSWLNFYPQSFLLEERKTRVIIPKLVLPLNTPAGEYAVAIKIRQVKAEGEHEPTAEVLSRFSVGETSFLSACKARVLTFFDTIPLAYLYSSLILLVLAGVLVNKYYRFRVEIKRR